MDVRPLHLGNRLQQAYARWAAPHYARLAPEVREQVELIDGFLYSRRGLWVWLGLAGAVLGSTAGLAAAGLPAWLALLLSLLVWCLLPLGGLAGWLQPATFAAPGVLRRKLPAALGLALSGALAGFVVGHVVRHGVLDLPLLLEDLWRGLRMLLPAALAGSLAMLAMTWGVARARLQWAQRVLASERLAHERDAAARQAAEARLRLLQAQIAPHFIFNTLAALQHWVDTGDARAAPLLRALTEFLRGATELLGREQATLGDELAVIRPYLSIQQARLGPRLQVVIEVDEDGLAVPLLPGLLLTLVENAVEHGLAPALDGGLLRIHGAWLQGRLPENDAGVASADRVLDLRISDNGVGLAPGWADGTGLRNSRERLRHLGDGRAQLSLTPLQPGTQARLLLPMPGGAGMAPPADLRSAE